MPDNRLLAALPISDRRRILSGCEIVELDLSELLYSPWQSVDSIYFPTSSFVSVSMPSGDSPTFEVGLVGSEGMLGTALALNATSSAERATVHGGGSALRMQAGPWRRELRRGGPVREAVDRYLHVRMGQLGQAVICAQFHLLEARVACRLLMIQDRSHANSFTITHEGLAQRLGARRAGVTHAANSLKRRRLIRYNRGNITVLDRRGLMSAACGCYKADRESYDRILGVAGEMRP